MGFNPREGEESFSVKSVESELIQGSMPQLRFKLAVEKGSLIVRPPSQKARETVEQVSAEAGEKSALSDADREIVALALDLETSGLDPVIVSDDYAVQNLAEHLHLRYSSLANFGIVHKFQWVIYCPACHRRYNQPAKTCRVCGTELRRKVLSKARIRRGKATRL